MFKSLFVIQIAKIKFCAPKSPPLANFGRMKITLTITNTTNKHA